MQRGYSDADMAGLRDRLQRIEDELAIRGLIGRLAQAGDRQQLDAYMDVFAEDAVIEIVGLAKFEGAAQIRAWAAGRWSGAPPSGMETRHLVTGTVIELDGDTARARSYFAVIGKGEGGLAVRSTGVYEDAFARTPRGWKLTYRKNTDRLA